MPNILNFPKSHGLRIENKAKDSAELIIYGAIGSSFWEDTISAKAVSDALKELDKNVKNLTVRINSPGGDVFDGISIYNRLRQLNGIKVTTVIDGLAASIASVIALAGDEVQIGEGALYMVHLPWSVAMGNRNDFENMTQRLMDVEEQLISIYAKKTKLSRQEIRGMLEKETWMDSAEAIDQGFVDIKAPETMPIAASVLDKATWLHKVPKNILLETDVIKKEVTNLQSKIEGFLARK